jgi:hypothetical protein
MSNLNQEPSQGTNKPNAQWTTLLAFGAISISGLIYTPSIYRALGPIMVLAIYDLSVLIFALISTVLAILLWRSFDRGETLSQIWGGIAIGLTLWLGGEFIWTLDQLWGGDSLPYPSNADILWILGYVPIIWALLKRFRTLRINPNQPWQKMILISYSLLVFLIVIYLIVPIVTDTETLAWYEKSVNLLYPLGDLMVGLLAILLVLVLSGGTLFGPWRLIAGGFLFVAISDLLYGLTLWQGTYQINPAEAIDPLSLIINMSYVAFYVLMAWGVYQQARMQNAV